jgi:hypothetical protein
MEQGEDVAPVDVDLAYVGGTGAAAFALNSEEHPDYRTQVFAGFYAWAFTLWRELDRTSQRPGLKRALLLFRFPRGAFREEFDYSGQYAIRFGKGSSCEAFWASSLHAPMLAKLGHPEGSEPGR